MANGNDKCGNCGGDRAIHHYQTDQCPVGGVESPVGKVQEFKTSTFAAEIPFDPPSRMARDMTVREYFAATLMAGWVNPTEPWKDYTPGMLADRAIKCADALIEALNK